MENIIKRRFGRLFVLRKVGRIGIKNGKYECICDCGNLCYPHYTSLLSGTTTSCGCFAVEVTKDSSKIKENDFPSILTEFILSGKTLEEIGSIHGVTRERIRQILCIFGSKEANSLRKSVKKFSERGEILEKKNKSRKEKNRLIAEFWNNVDIRGAKDCWNYTGSVANGGYGTCSITVNGKKIRGSHRMSWYFYNGEFPKNSWVLHKCDNPSCCNPDHLYLGDAKKNAEDREERGRGNKFALSHQEKLLISSLKANNHNEICELAKRFNVSPVTISRNINGQYEEHVRKKRNKRHKIDNSMRECFLVDYRNMKPSQLASKYNITEGTIYTTLDRFGISRNKFMHFELSTKS